MSVRTKRRYRNADQVIAEIDRCRYSAQLLLETADKLELEATRLVVEEQREGLAQARREEAARARKRATRILEERLGKLGQKLSQLKTPPLPLPGLAGDCSVPVRLDR